MLLTRFRFHIEIVVIVILVLKISLLLTRFPNFSLLFIYLGGTRERAGTYAPIGYLRVKNVFSFDSHSKEIIQLKQINSYQQADMCHPFCSRVLIVNLNEIQFLNRSIENRDSLHRNSARRKTIQFRTL